MTNIGVFTGLFNSAIDRTEALIDLILAGELITDDYIRAWQLQMYNLGLIPHPDTFIHGGGETTDPAEWFTEPIITALTSIIEQENAQTRSSAFSQFLFINDTIEQQNQSTRDQLDTLYDDIEILNYQNTLQIIDYINSLDLDTTGIVDEITSSMQDLFITQSNRIEAFRQQQTDILLADSADSTNQILTRIDSITNTGGSGNSDSFGGLNINDLEPYLIDLLNVLNDVYLAIQAKELSVTVNNDVNSGSGGESDSSASLPNIGNIAPHNVAQFFSELFAVGIQPEIGGIADRLQQLITIVEKATTNQYQSYEELMADFNNIAGTGDFTDFIIKAVLIVPTLLSTIMSVIQPFVNNLETLARTEALDGLIPPDVIRELFIRRIITANDMNNLFRKIGYNPEQASRFIQTGKIQLQDAYAREAYLRGIIDEGQHDDYLDKLGYQQSDIDLIRQTYFRIPPIPDLIRFAVREAYDENLATDLQLDSGYDTIKERFERDLRENGLHPDYGSLYWRSHWDLPSPTQGYEMLHRGVITEDELEQLLKVSDYSPQWISKLMDISYTPYTRVDIRRMHKLGVLSDTDVKKAYMDIGYNDEKSTKMMDFTIQLNSDIDPDKDKDLSQANILRAYKVDLLDRATSSTMLQQLGYNERESNILLDMQDLGITVDKKVDVLADNKRRITNSVSRAFIEGTLSEQASRFYLSQVGYLPDDLNIEIQTLRSERNILLQNERINNTMKGYIEFRLSDNEVRSILAREGFTPLEENDLLALWNTQRDDRFSNPTKAELKRWFVAGHVTEFETAEYLRGMGYDNKLVDLYMQDFNDSMNS